MTASAHRRVVVTGLGLLSPIGNTVDDAVQQVRERRSGISNISEQLSTIAGLHTQLGGRVTGVDLAAHFPRKKRRTMGPVALLASVATKQAIEMAGLESDTLSSGSVGIAYGSTSGSSSARERFAAALIERRELAGLEATAFIKFMSHTCAANLAHMFSVRGRIIPTCSACTSGSQAIGYGYEAIKHGNADAMICGGAEELHYSSVVVFDLMMATSAKYNDSPAVTPRPFDVARDGLVVGEGAATLILESLEHAEARGANILAEVIGFGTNCDGLHPTRPSKDGMRRALALATEDAGIDRDAIEYVNAHGTATELGDIAESHATYEFFERAIPISSLKSYTGHTLGACGAIEAALTIRMMNDGFVAPTINLDAVDPKCAPLDYVTETREAQPKITMSNNFAFGGVNTSLIFRGRSSFLEGLSAPPSK